MSNRYFYNDRYACLVSKNGEHIVISIEDLPKSLEHTWCVSKTGYAVATINQKTVKMHRWLLGVTDKSVEVDHINRDKLINTRDNLRLCTHKENGMNQSETKGRELPIGVSLTREGKYRARIMKGGKEINLGHYDKLEDAILARYKGEIKYFCGFRYKNNS